MYDKKIRIWPAKMSCAGWFMYRVQMHSGAKQDFRAKTIFRLRNDGPEQAVQHNELPGPSNEISQSRKKKTSFQ
jgi:hypothetical protein